MRMVVATSPSRAGITRAAGSIMAGVALKARLNKNGIIPLKTKTAITIAAFQLRRLGSTGPTRRNRLINQNDEFCRHRFFRYSHVCFSPLT